MRELLAHFGRYYEPFARPGRPRPFDVDELLALVRLTEHADQRVGSLSGGQRRRLDVAIGIVGRPQLLFLDEPTAGFDPQARRDFHELVHRLADVDGTTILLTTHDLAEAEKLADRILILAGGRIVADGSADQLARQVAGRTEVRWSRAGERYVHATEDATSFVRELLDEPGEEVRDLEVRRTSLEETYMDDRAPARERAGRRRRRGGPPMSASRRVPAGPLSRLSPLRLGLTRGWIAFRSMITSREGITQNLIWNLIPLGRARALPGHDAARHRHLLRGRAPARHPRARTSPSVP